MFGIKRHFIFYLTFVASVMMLMTYQSRTSAISPFASIKSPLYGMNKAIDSATVKVSGSMRSDSYIESLRLRNAELELKAQYFNELKAENDRLISMLDLVAREPGLIAIARVVSRGSSQWENAVVIDKGLVHGVHKDYAVVTADGLAGKVAEAMPMYSKVLLVDDPAFSAAVRLEQDGTEAVMSGRNPGRCVLKFAGLESTVSTGSEIITSGVDGLFPPGLKVGYISKSASDDRGLFYEAEIIPYVKTTSIREVVVVSR